MSSNLKLELPKSIALSALAPPSLGYHSAPPNSIPLLPVAAEPSTTKLPTLQAILPTVLPSLRKSIIVPSDVVRFNTAHCPPDLTTEIPPAG